MSLRDSLQTSESLNSSRPPTYWRSQWLMLPVGSHWCTLLDVQHVNSLPIAPGVFGSSVSPCKHQSSQQVLGRTSTTHLQAQRLLATGGEHPPSSTAQQNHCLHHAWCSLAMHGWWWLRHGRVIISSFRLKMKNEKQKKSCPTAKLQGFASICQDWLGFIRKYDKSTWNHSDATTKPLNPLKAPTKRSSLYKQH